MGRKDVVGYVEWDEVVQRAEANIEIILGNKKKAEVGEVCEKVMLDYALKQRAKFPKPKKGMPNFLKKATG